MKKILLYYSFVVVNLMTLMGFLESKTYPQLLSAILFYPMALYLWMSILPKKKKALALEIPKQQNIKEKIEEEIIATPQEAKNFDLDRRMFIKLIGGAGLSLFLMSLFTKKAEAAFFGSVPGPGTVGIKDTGGNLIDPAKHHPTDGYRISRLDADSTPSYYGFTNANNAWFIMKEDVSGNYTYVTGSSGFTTTWGVHDQDPPTGPTYQEFYEAF